MNIYDILIGFVMPFIADLLNKYVENSKLRFVVALLSCLVASVVVHFADLKAGDPGEVLASAAMIFSASQAMYKLIYKDSKAQIQIRGAVDPVSANIVK